MPATAHSHSRQEISARPLFEAKIVNRALVQALLAFNPRRLLKNPVMFVVAVGSAFTTALWIHALVTGKGDASPGFILAVSLWLWFTVYFANFAEAMAEGRRPASLQPARFFRCRPDRVP